MEYKYAIVKWNNGNGALLCNTCNVIIEEGFDHEDRENWCPSCALDELAHQAQEWDIE